AGAVEAEGSVPLREDSEASSQGIMSLPLEDLGLQSEDLASQRERGSGFTVNEDPSSGSVYAGIPALPLKRTSAPQAVPVTREKKDEKEESARSSRRSSVSSVVAESIEEIGMEPMAKDASYGRALSAEMVPPTSQQDSAEAGQGDSTPGAEPVTRQKKDEKEESARSSRRSSVSSSVAESIEEIGMEPVARGRALGRALSVEMAPPTAKESSAEAAQVGPLPGAEPVTREKKDEKESARSSRRSSVSSFMAESIEEIGTEPVTHQGHQDLMAPQHLPCTGGSQEPRVLSGIFADDLEEISVEPVFATGRIAQAQMSNTQHKTSFSDRAFGAEMAAGLSLKQGGADDAQSSLAGVPPATREKKDENEGAAMISQRSSASSSVADAIEEISMEPEPATKRMSSDLLGHRQAASNGPLEQLFTTQDSGASALESVAEYDAGLIKSQQGRADRAGPSSRQEAITARSCSHSSSGASSTDMKCREPEPAPHKQDTCLQHAIFLPNSPVSQAQDHVRISNAPSPIRDSGGSWRLPEPRKSFLHKRHRISNKT
ncbi:unnamed protein product, partial [Symbiodinium sp. KB8]